MKTNLSDVVANARLLQATRKAKSETDFGDQKTVGLKVKAIDKSYDELEDHDFGVYLGYYNGQYHVGTNKILDLLEPSKLVSYDTLEELHENWILD